MQAFGESPELMVFDTVGLFRFYDEHWATQLTNDPRWD
jgi:hypothetical protein